MFFADLFPYFADAAAVSGSAGGSLWNSFTDSFKNLTDFSWASQGGAWVGLLTLVALEVVLGIDNIIFISILSSKLPAAEQVKARKTGLILAVTPRLIFLLLLGVILGLQTPLFYLPINDPGRNHPDPTGQGRLGLTGQDLVLLLGGIFLIIQAVREIHHKLEGQEHAADSSAPRGVAKYRAVLTQIMFMNIIFSLDSIITAIGMVPREQILVMIIAVLVSTGIMIYAVDPISRFVEKHPTVKMLALAFLLLIGTNLLAEAAHFHIPKGYIYFAMGFSVLVEILNIRASRGKSQPVHLHPPA